MSAKKKEAPPTTTLCPPDKHILPTNKDFLIGKDKTCKGNGGNLALKSMVEERFDEYHDTDARSSVLDQPGHRSKRDIQLEIIEAIKSDGGRFLRRCDPKNNSSPWCDVSKQEEINVIIGAFRNHKRNEKKRAESLEKDSKFAETAPEKMTLKEAVQERNKKIRSKPSQRMSVASATQRHDQPEQIHEAVHQQDSTSPTAHAGSPSIDTKDDE